MAKVLQPITACLKKGQITEREDDHTSMNKDKESEDGRTSAQKTDDENAGLLWRMSSQLYNLGSGAVGLGVGSVKWAASTTYTVGSGVVSVTQTAVSKVVPSVLPKPKKE